MSKIILDVLDEPLLRLTIIMIIIVIICYIYMVNVHYGYYYEMDGYPIIKKEKLKKVMRKEEIDGVVVMFSDDGIEKEKLIKWCEIGKIEFVKEQEQIHVERIETIHCRVHKRWFHKHETLIATKITYKLYELETLKVINYTSSTPFLIRIL